MSEILIQPGLLPRIGALLKERGFAGSVALISDDTVMPLYGGRVRAALEEAGYVVHAFSFAPGEGSKTLSTYAAILDFLCTHAFTRTDTVVALGGGVVGDIAGFAAATYLRGLRLVQVPTTLLACVDSSVGGKTAIDLPGGKNLVGAFYLPHLVVIDPDTLHTLPDSVLTDGCAEVIKYAALRGSPLYDALPLTKDRAGSIIAQCVDIKRDIVSRDFTDQGERQLLNFGHTFGHAIEKLSGYQVPHGQAVAIGMAMMARASLAMGCCTKADCEKLVQCIRASGLSTTTPYPPDALYEALQSDKKRAGDMITLVLFHSMGDCRLHRLPLADVRRMVKEGWA